MAFQTHKDFAYSTIPTGGGPSPATTGASLKVASASDRALFPTPPFMATVWPSGASPTAANAEIVQINGTTGTDGFVMARAQEGSTAQAIVAGYQIAATVTTRPFTDLEAATADMAHLSAAETFTGAHTYNYGTLLDKGSQVFHATAYGIKADGKTVTDGTITAGTKGFTSATASFTASDVNKQISVNGAGTAGAVLNTTIKGVGSSTNVTLAINAETTVGSAVTFYATDDTTSVRNAMYDALNKGGGTVVLPPGIIYINTNGGIVPAVNGNTDTTVPVTFQGAGMQATTLKQGVNIGVIFHYSVPGGGFPKVAQTFVRDLTLDGNYAGVANGAIPQDQSAQFHMVSLQQPYTSASGSQAQFNGLYHVFQRVRFYRPSGFTTQALTALFDQCVFDQCGQPDIPSDGLHWDNIGNGGGVDVIVQNCSWVNSSGNYADFVSGTANDFLRITFIGNTSVNHQIGGVYACGTGSVIIGNHLVNRFSGSFIEYDAATHESNRFNNIVANNTLTNIGVNNGSTAWSRGDRIFNNTAFDIPKEQITPPAPNGNITGTTNASSTTAITGINTKFTTQVLVGDRISLSSAGSTFATVTSITDDTHLTIDTALGNGASQSIRLQRHILALYDQATSLQAVWNDIGYAGIGTVSPNERATVEGALSLRASGTMPSTTSNYGKLHANSGDNNLYYRDPAGNLLLITTTPATSTSTSISSTSTSSTSSSISSTSTSSTSSSTSISHSTSSTSSSISSTSSSSSISSTSSSLSTSSTSSSQSTSSTSTSTTVIAFQ